MLVEISQKEEETPITQIITLEEEIIEEGEETLDEEEEIEMGLEKDRILIS